MRLVDENVFEASATLLEFLSPIRRGPVGPLTSVTAADQFWQLLPREDPVAAQRAVSEVLAVLATRNQLTLGQFRALLALDQLARGLGDALLVDYLTGAAQSPSPETNAWQSAYALSRSFGQAFERALLQIQNNEPARGWHEHLTTVLLRLFQHRQVEFLLQPFTSEHSVLDGWAGIHGAYRYADAIGARLHPLVSRRCHEECGETSTLEREYIHLLLLQLLNGGHLSPYEAFWLNRKIPRWCAVLSLQAEPACAVAGCVDHRFVVDLDSATGLAWPSGSPAGTPRFLDPAPLLALIRVEIAALSDPARPTERSSPLRRGRQLKLLGAIATNCLPKTAPIDRRGARLPAVSSVEAVVGLAQITQLLRHERRAKTVAMPWMLPEIEAGTNTVTGERTAAAGSWPNGGPDTVGMAGESGVQGFVWQMKDRSESGCRLRGRIVDSNRVLPGTLVAFREHHNVPWTLAVVRRLRQRMGDRIDIGVEYIGQDPLVVTMAADVDRTAGSTVASDRRRKYYSAIHLHESSGHPHLPFRTLILSVREFNAGRCLSLRSDGAEYTVRLKEPIEELDSFVWLSYELVFRLATDGQTQGRPYGGRPAIARQPNQPPLAARSAIAAEPAPPLATRRAGGAGNT
jgi:hypothetical protein